MEYFLASHLDITCRKNGNYYFPVDQGWTSVIAIPGRRSRGPGMGSVGMRGNGGSPRRCQWTEAWSLDVRMVEHPEVGPSGEVDRSCRSR